MLEKSLINTVHLGKTIHCIQENINLDNLFEGGAGGSKDGGEVLDAELGHGGDVRRFESKDFAAWGARDLARAVDCGGSGYCLGLVC